MKLAILAAEFLPIWGGSGTYTVELVKSLPKEIEIHLITLKRDVDGITYSADDIRNYLNKDITIHFISNAEESFLYNATFQYATFKMLPKLNMKYCFDLVHNNYPHMSDILLKLTGKEDVPFVTTVHTTLKGHMAGIKSSKLNFFDLEGSEKYTTLLYPVLRLSESFYLKKSKWLISPSQWMKSILIKDYNIDPSIIFTVPYGVDHNMFSHKDINECNKIFPSLANINKPLVCFSGRLTATKGIHILIKAMAKIFKDRKDVHFVFAGGGPKEFWINYLNSNGIPKDCYTFLGYVDFKLMPYLYSMSSIFVVPSLYENMPLRILEVMSIGKPVISTDVCAIPELIKSDHNGLLVPPWGIDQLKNNIEYLIENEDVAKKLSNNARKTIIEEYTWDKIIKKTCKVYDEILESKNKTGV